VTRRVGLDSRRWKALRHPPLPDSGHQR